MSISADLISKIIQSLIGLNIYKIILFGSYARGTANENSDIDLVVILDSDEMSQLFKDRMARRRPVSRSLLEINRQYPMDIIVYTKAEYDFLKGKEDFFIQEIEETGRELYIESRYPSNIGLFQDGSLPTVEEAKSYLDLAKSIANIVKSEIGSFNTAN